MEHWSHILNNDNTNRGNSFVLVAEKGKLQLPGDVRKKRLLEGTVPPSCLQSLIRSNQHRREKLQSRLISQNGASVMGNKWTTTVNCSSLLHALWLIQSQRETFLERQNSFSLFWGNVCMWGALIAVNAKDDIERAGLQTCFNFCHPLHMRCTCTEMRHSSARSPIVNNLARVPSSPRPRRSWEMLT